MPLVSAIVFSLLLGQTPDWPQTRAERTQFKETSTYADVVAFLDDLQRSGAPISVKWMGNSTEGKPMPLVIASRPLVASAAQAKASGKPIVYVQANIHAGEVEGKEAILALLRNYSREKSGLLDKFIFLITPIYNIDGNEKFGPVERNRPGQVGPASVGVRPNGQGLDLNRDCMKAESPEMRGILEHVYSWDPDVVFDLHTTDGTRHGYQLTYSPGLHPNTDPTIRKFTQDELLPKIRREAARNGLRLFDYGNAAREEGKTDWQTFGYEGRYVTNYAGLRNRIGILSEAMNTCPFDERVKATEEFVHRCLTELARQAKRVTDMTRAADARSVAMASRAPELGVRFKMDSRGEDAVLMEKAGATRRTGPVTEWEMVRMKVYDRFSATKTAKLPHAYLFLGVNTNVATLLARHGARVETLKSAWKGPVQWFSISQSNTSPNAFQGHRMVRLEGSFVGATMEYPAGSFLVRTAQPLANVIFDLLEPESLDGVASWGLFGEDWTSAKEFPIVKVFGPVHSPSVQWHPNRS